MWVPLPALGGDDGSYSEKDRRLKAPFRKRVAEHRPKDPMTSSRPCWPRSGRRSRRPGSTAFVRVPGVERLERFADALGIASAAPPSGYLREEGGEVGSSRTRGLRTIGGGRGQGGGGRGGAPGDRCMSGEEGRGLTGGARGSRWTPSPAERRVGALSGRATEGGAAHPQGRRFGRVSHLAAIEPMNSEPLAPLAAASAASSANDAMGSASTRTDDPANEEDTGGGGGERGG